MKRYSSWSSRLSIEFLALFLSDKILLWKILSATFTVLLFHSIHQIISEFVKNKRILNPIITIIFFIILLFNVIFNYSAGIYATSINYLYPISLALYAINIFIKGNNTSKYKYFTAVFALVFSVFNEQVSLAIASLSTITIAYMFIKKTAAKPISYRKCVVLFIISFAGVLNVILCPGNKVRVQGEININFPAFGKLNILGKIVCGIDSTFVYLTSLSNLLFYAIIIVIVIILLLNNKRIQSLFVGLLTLLFIFPQIVPVHDYSKAPIIFTFLNTFQKNYEVDLSLRFMKSLSLNIYYLLVFLGIIIVIIMLYKYSRCKIPAILLSLGILLRLTVSFIPTVLISETRPFLITFICFYIALFLLIDELIIIALYKNNSGMQVNISNTTPNLHASINNVI